MTQAAPFSPDRDYCVYCHAPAAGMCAVCGALCCADCVELVMGVATPRATCRACLKAGRTPAGTAVFIRTALKYGAILAVALAGLIYFTR